MSKEIWKEGTECVIIDENSPFYGARCKVRGFYTDFRGMGYYIVQPQSTYNGYSAIVVQIDLLRTTAKERLCEALIAEINKNPIIFNESARRDPSIVNKIVFEHLSEEQAESFLRDTVSFFRLIFEAVASLKN